jgi:hypothetical protein
MPHSTYKTLPLTGQAQQGVLLTSILHLFQPCQENHFIAT